MIDRCLIGTQADRHHNVVYQLIAGVTAVLKDRNIFNVPMKLSTTQSDLLAD